MEYKVITIIMIILVFVFIIIKKFNTMIFLNKKVGQAESNIDVFLKRRYDMITKLQEVVKGYAKHEKSVLTKITKIRSDMSIKEKEKSKKDMDESLGKLNIIVEKHPDLKASENFMQLQESIVDCEDNLAAARRIYNSNVNDYNIYISKFPNIIISKILKYKEFDYFEYDEN